jgi:hypothetical protein
MKGITETTVHRLPTSKLGMANHTSFQECNQWEISQDLNPQPMVHKITWKQITHRSSKPE